MLLFNSIDYLPAIRFFSLIQNTNEIFFNSNGVFDKRLHNNQCRIAGSAGIISLSIPLLNGRHQKKKLKEVEIFNDYNWKKQHWHTILSCYNKSPFFIYYKEEFQQLFFQDQQRLVYFNLSLLKWCLSKLKFNIAIYFCDHNYYDSTLLKNAPTYIQKTYNQVFENKNGFLNNCSIIDLLFNEGNNAINFL